VRTQASEPFGRDLGRSAFSPSPMRWPTGVSPSRFGAPFMGPLPTSFAMGIKILRVDSAGTNHPAKPWPTTRD